MKLNIVQLKEDDELTPIFLDSIVKLYIYYTYESLRDMNKFKEIDLEFNINSDNICKIALLNLTISKPKPNIYTLSIDKRLKINGESIMKYINCITYGNRSVKGYSIINDVFNYVGNNLDRIYKEFTSGY